MDFGDNRNLIVAAVTLILGAGDFTIHIGSFTLGGIGTATFGAIIHACTVGDHSLVGMGAIILNALMELGERHVQGEKEPEPHEADLDGKSQ